MLKVFFFQEFRSCLVTRIVFIASSGCCPFCCVVWPHWAALGAVGMGQCPGQGSTASLRICSRLQVPSQFCGCGMWQHTQLGVVLAFQIQEGDCTDQFSSYCSFTAVPLHRINKKLIPADPVKLSIYSACHSLECFGIWSTAVSEGLLSALSLIPFFSCRSDSEFCNVLFQSWTNC